MWWVAAALACETGPDCFAEAEVALDTSPVKALTLYQDSCDREHPRGCWKAANLLVHGSAVIPDLERSTALKERTHALAEQACTEDDAACTTLGLSWYWGIGVDKDSVEAHVLFHRACDAGDGEACHWAAVLSRQCIPAFLMRYPFNEYCTEADNDRGVLALLQRSCSLEDTEGCVALALHAERRLRDLEAAAHALQSACALGHEGGCVRLARHERAAGLEELGRDRLVHWCTEAASDHTRTIACIAAAAHDTRGESLLDNVCGTDGHCWHTYGRALTAGAYGLDAPDLALGAMASARACALGSTVSCVP